MCDSREMEEVDGTLTEEDLVRMLNDVDDDLTFDEPVRPLFLQLFFFFSRKR